MRDILGDCAPRQGLQNNEFTFTADKFAKNQNPKTKKYAFPKNKILRIFLWMKFKSSFPFERACTNI